VFPTDPKSEAAVTQAAGVAYRSLPFLLFQPSTFTQQAPAR